MTDRTPTRLPESIAVYGNRSHRQSRSLPLARALLSHVAAALMPLSVSLVLARTLLFSPNATSLNAYATSLNAYSHTLAPISHPTPPQCSVARKRQSHDKSRG
jgi:hypothetical protein